VSSGAGLEEKEKGGSISYEKSKWVEFNVKMTAILACHIRKVSVTNRYGPTVNRKSK
jgi:hypothetical protein